MGYARGEIQQDAGAFGITRSLSQAPGSFCCAARFVRRTHLNMALAQFPFGAQPVRLGGTSRARFPVGIGQSREPMVCWGIRRVVTLLTSRNIVVSDSGVV